MNRQTDSAEVQTRADAPVLTRGLCENYVQKGYYRDKAEVRRLVRTRKSRATTAATCRHVLLGESSWDTSGQIRGTKTAPFFIFKPPPLPDTGLRAQEFRGGESGRVFRETGETARMQGYDQKAARLTGEPAPRRIQSR